MSGPVHSDHYVAAALAGEATNVSRAPADHGIKPSFSDRPG